MKEIGHYYFESGAKNTIAKMQVKRERVDTLQMFDNEKQVFITQCEADPNIFIDSAIVDIAQEIGTEPYILEFMFCSILPKLCAENEAFKAQILKMMVAAKITHHDQIGTFRKARLQKVAEDTERNQRNNRGHLTRIEQRQEAALRRISDKSKNLDRLVNSWKEYIVEHAQAMISGQTSLDHLGPRNRLFIQILDDAGLVVKAGNVYEFCTNKFVNEMTDGEISILAARLNAKLNHQSPCETPSSE